STKVPCGRAGGSVGASVLMLVAGARWAPLVGRVRLCGRTRPRGREPCSSGQFRGRARSPIGERSPRRAERYSACVRSVSGNADRWTVIQAGPPRLLPSSQGAIHRCSTWVSRASGGQISELPWTRARSFRNLSEISREAVAVPRRRRRGIVAGTTCRGVVPGESRRGLLQ